MKNSLTRLFPGAIACLGVLATMLVLTDARAAVRAIVVLPFLLVGPGLAVVELIGLSDVLERVVLAIAVSFALEVIVSLAMLYGGVWSASLGISILTGIAVVAAIVSYIAGSERRRW